MDPVCPEPPATSLVFDVPLDSQLTDDEFASDPTERPTLLRHPSACADVCALHLQRRNTRTFISCSSLVYHLPGFPLCEILDITNLLPLGPIPASLRLPVIPRLSKLIVRYRQDYDSTGALFGLLHYLPGLRVLELDGVWPTILGRENAVEVPPFSLESFTCNGIISLEACARLVEGSARTLRVLRVTGLEQEADKPVLIRLARAVVNVAPGLRALALALPDCGAFKSSLDALVRDVARAQTIRFEASGFRALWSIACSLCAGFRGHVELFRTPARNQPRGPPGPTEVQDIVIADISASNLRSLTVWGFRIGAASADELLARCAGRRIRCTLLA